VALGVGKADGRGEPLTQWPRRDLNALGMTVLRVTGSLRAPLPQGFDVLELQPETTEVELDVLRERTVAGGEDEAVAPDPVRVSRVMPHHALIEEIGRWREADRRP